MTREEAVAWLRAEHKQAKDMSIPIREAKLREIIEIVEAKAEAGEPVKRYLWAMNPTPHIEEREDGPWVYYTDYARDCRPAPAASTEGPVGLPGGG